MKYITVDELIETLKNISAEGKGSYRVGCNEEYGILREFQIDDDLEVVDFEAC